MNRIFKTAVLASVLAAVAGGCAGTTATQEDKVKVVIGNWPTENNPIELENKNNTLEKVTKKYPHIEFIPDTWSATPESFLSKASANQLPTVYPVFFTEVKKIISAGYAADLTDYMDDYEFWDDIDETTKALISENGRIYGIPSLEYCMCLYVNMNIFREAGLIKEDGTAIFPDTYSELLETARIIKEKTGKAGFVMPSASNWGGWHFMNIAWSFGAEFMRKNEDERWIACFDSNEAVEALQFIKDMKWKYNVLPEENYIDSYETLRMFAEDEVGMFIAGGISKNLATTYNMEPSSISVGKMPEGPKGRYALLGGSVAMISAGSTPEQIEGGLMWLKEMNVESESKNKEDTGSDFKQIKKGIFSSYLNIEWKFIEDYVNGLNDVTLRVEEPINAQGLYQTLDACIREVFENPDADCRDILEEACMEFQKNYLDDVEL